MGRYKSEALFDAGLKLRELEDDLKRRDTAKARAHAESEKNAHWREEELQARRRALRLSSRLYASAQRLSVVLTVGRPFGRATLSVC